MNKAVQAGVYTQGADIVKGQTVIGQNNGSVKAAQEATGMASGVAQGVTNQTVAKNVKRAGDADKYIEGASQEKAYKEEQSIREVKQKVEDGYTAKKMATAAVAAEEIKADQTEQLIAAFGSKKEYVEKAANTGADNEIKNIKATDAEAEKVDKALVGNGSQASKLKNMGVVGSFDGTKKGSEEARPLGEIAYDMLGYKVGKVPSNIDATKSKYDALVKAGDQTKMDKAVKADPALAAMDKIVTGKDRPTMEDRKKASETSAAPSREKLKEYQGKLAEYANDREGFKQAIKGDRELEAIDRHFTAGVNDAPMVDRANNFNRALADYSTKLAQQKGGFDASQIYGNLTQDQKTMKSLDLPDNNDGRARLAELQNHGLLNEREAAAINKGYGFKPGEGPFQKGMIIDSYGVGKDGKMMVNKASYQGPDGKSVTVADGEISTSQAMNRKQLEKYAQTLDKDHALEAFAVREMAGRLGKGESAKVNETRGFDGHFISSNVMHGGDTNLKGGGGESLELKNGQAVRAGTVTEKNLPGLLKDAKKAGFTELEDIKPGSQYQQQWGVDGGGKPVLTGMSVKKEGESSYKDLAQEKTGMIKQQVDENTRSINHGPHIENAGWMAQKGDKALFMPISDRNSATNPPASSGWKADVQAITNAIVKDAQAVYSQNGVSLNIASASTGVEVSGGLHTPSAKGGIFSAGISAKASTNVLADSQDRKSWDLLNANINAVIKKAEVEAYGKKMNTDQAAQYTAEKVQAYMNKNIYEPAEKLKPGAFGATAPGTALLQSGTNSSEISEEAKRLNPSLNNIGKRR